MQAKQRGWRQTFRCRRGTARAGPPPVCQRAASRVARRAGAPAAHAEQQMSPRGVRGPRSRASLRPSTRWRPSNGSSSAPAAGSGKCSSSCGGGGGGASAVSSRRRRGRGRLRRRRRGSGGLRRRGCRCFRPREDLLHRSVLGLAALGHFSGVKTLVHVHAPQELRVRARLGDQCAKLLEVCIEGLHA